MRLERIAASGNILRLSTSLEIFPPETPALSRAPFDCFVHSFLLLKKKKTGHRALTFASPSLPQHLSTPLKKSYCKIRFVHVHGLHAEKKTKTHTH